MIPQIYFADITTVMPMPVYVQTQPTDYTKKCLESDTLADLNAKQLQGEQFTEEDAARITDCIAQKKANEGEVAKWILIGFAIFFVVIIILGCFSI